MRASYELSFQGETLQLLPERAIYWPRLHALLLADLHLGKASHFQQHGIALHSGALQQDLDRLTQLCERYQPQQLIFLGDLFHSRYNQEWDAFCQWRQRFSGEAILVRGNHDILSPDHYQAAALQVVQGVLPMEPFCLVHDLAELPDDVSGYPLSGHLHPGVRMNGRGRQQLRLPCFYFGQSGGILPAFGRLTGLAMLAPKAEDLVFVLVEDQVIAV